MKTWAIYLMTDGRQRKLGTVEADHQPGALLAAIAKFGLKASADQRRLRAKRLNEEEDKRK